MTRNQRLSAVRAWLHDAICVSDNCHGDNEHAQRTQRGAARAFVNATDATGRAEALHPTFCLAAAGGACQRREQHLARINEVVPANLASEGAA